MVPETKYWNICNKYSYQDQSKNQVERHIFLIQIDIRSNGNLTLTKYWEKMGKQKSGKRDL